MRSRKCFTGLPPGLTYALLLFIKPSSRNTFIRHKTDLHFVVDCRMVCLLNEWLAFRHSRVERAFKVQPMASYSKACPCKTAEPFYYASEPLTTLNLFSFGRKPIHIRYNNKRTESQGSCFLLLLLSLLMFYTSSHIFNTTLFLFTLNFNRNNFIHFKAMNSCERSI